MKRLVALAMDLGLARQRLERGDDPAETVELVGHAHDHPHLAAFGTSFAAIVTRAALRPIESGHEALLDWLAAELQSTPLVPREADSSPLAWSIKRLHRQA